MPPLGYVVALVVCGLFVVIGLFGLIQAAVFVSFAVWKAEGTVVGFEESNDGDGVAYYPIFCFEALGREWRVVNPMAGMFVREGQRVTVFYSPSAPEKARIGRERHLILPVVFLLMGLAMGSLILWFGFEPR